MKWQWSIEKYIGQYCSARGLRPGTLRAYRESLIIFSEYMKERYEITAPEAVKIKHVLGYVEHMRNDRGNHDASINRAVTIVRSYY